MKKNPTNKTGLSRRLSFPEDEKRLPWLPMLLDCYAIADTGVAIAVRDAGKKRKKVLACAKGCDVCCRQPDIPLYPHELVGIYWYASEKLEQQVRDIVKGRLAGHTKGSPCPFLVEGSCAVHPLRPLSCRQFNVFTAPCSEGEDPYYTRRDDVLIPLEDYTDRAFSAVISFYQLPERDPGSAARMVRKQIMNLQEYDWKKLADMMESKKG
jgi:Fe-S-cluster containining protein